MLRIFIYSETFWMWSYTYRPSVSLTHAAAHTLGRCHSQFTSPSCQLYHEVKENFDITIFPKSISENLSVSG